VTDISRLPEALNHVPERLGEELGGALPIEEVHATVAAAYHELAASARVTSFLPILTEKVARDRLFGRTEPRRHQSLSPVRRTGHAVGVAQRPVHATGKGASRGA
jgi:hypothetical protein